MRARQGKQQSRAKRFTPEQRRDCADPTCRCRQHRLRRMLVRIRSMRLQLRRMRRRALPCDIYRPISKVVRLVTMSERCASAFSLQLAAPHKPSQPVSSARLRCSVSVSVLVRHVVKLADVAIAVVKRASERPDRPKRSVRQRRARRR